MSDMFESLELNMREEAERVNPTKAIMATQLECEQRFESFVSKNPERVDFLSDDIRSVADKYAAEYNIPSETIYDATVTHLKEAAVKRAEWDKPWTEEDESKEESEESEAHEESESEEEEEKEHEEKEEEKKESSVKIAEVSLVPPEGVRSAAKRGIKYHSEGKAGDGFESATLARAKRIAAGEELTPEHVKRMHSFFERHAGGRSDKAGQGEITPWDVAWLAWGGNAGRSWAASKVEELERAEKTSAKKCDCWEGYKRVPGTKPCSPGSCEKCDSHRKKEAAIEDFILSNEDALVPEWIKKNAGWREMLRGFMNKKELFDPYDAAEWSSKDKPLPARARRMQEAEDINEQPTIEFSPARSDSSEYEDMIEDQSRAEEKMKENARKRQEMFESEPEYKTRGQHRYEYLRGASVQALEEFYIAQGMPAKTASILVEAVGEMAQLQTNEPGLPVGSSDPDSINIDKEIGGSEGDKYKNLDVAQKQKELGLEHQDFTDFGEPVREFIQPGGEAPYSENTKERIDGAEQDDLNAKGVKQDDNAPKKSSSRGGLRGMFTDLQLQSLRNHYEDGGGKISPSLLEKCKRLGLCGEDGQFTDKFKQMLDQHVENSGDGPEKLKSMFSLGSEQSTKKSSASVKEASGYVYKADGYRVILEDHGKNFYSVHLKLEDGSEEEIGEIMGDSDGWTADSGIGPGKNFSSEGDAIKYLINSSPWIDDEKRVSKTLDFDTIDSEVEKLMAEGMTPEQAVQSLGVYNNNNEPKGWGGSKVFEKDSTETKVAIDDEKPGINNNFTVNEAIEAVAREALRDHAPTQYLQFQPLTLEETIASAKNMGRAGDLDPKYAKDPDNYVIQVAYADRGYLATYEVGPNTQPILWAD